MATNAQTRWRTIGLQIYKDRTLYMLLIPAIAYFIIFHYIPIWGAKLAFEEYRFIGPNKWVGWKNFQILFGSGAFLAVLKNTVIISLMKMFICFPVPVALALLINELRSQKFKKYVQSVIYLPHFLSWVVIAGIFITILSPTDGLINELIKLLGGKPVSFMTSLAHFRWVLVFSELWRSAGWDTILYIAALASIDKALYEAATIDGANRWKQLVHITFPELKITIVTVFILNLGFFMNAGFDQVFNMMNDAVISVADIIDTYVYRVGLLNANFAYATAAGLFKGVIGLVLVMFTNMLSKRFSGKGIW